MTSRFLSNGAPTLCASCSAPFESDDGRLEAWRVGAHYFCSSCAERIGRRPPQSRAPQQAAEITSLSVRIAIPGSLRIGSALPTAGLAPSRRYP
jgi:hypothetical protein